MQDLKGEANSMHTALRFVLVIKHFNDFVKFISKVCFKV